jgi:putative redox protein
MPTVSATLHWQKDLRFLGEIGTTRLVLDANGAAGPSPVEALVLALAGCMAVDVADILTKGRHTFRGIETDFVGQRAEDPPRRLVSASLTFTVIGAVPESAIERAIQLSRDKYCSVWHSLRQDIVLETRSVVRA